MNAESGISGGGDPEVVGSHGDGEPDLLQRRYRRMLTLLPRAYREARGEEMLGVLMDGAPERRSWPAVREVLSVAALGIRVRSGTRGEGPTWLSARPLARAVALTGSLWMAFTSVLFGVEEVRFWQRFGPQNSGAGWHGLISTVATVLGFLLWPIVFLALVRGWRLAARSLSAVLAVVGAISVTSLYTFAYLVPEFVTVLAIGLATQKDFPAMRRPRRLAPMLLALTAVGWYLEAGMPRGDSWADRLRAYGPLAAFCLAVLVLAIRLARRSAVWPLAFAVVGTFLAGQWALISLRYEASLLDPRLEAAVLFEGCLVLIAGYAVLRRMLKAQTAQSVGGAI
jgi:hypothetical protein